MTLTRDPLLAIAKGILWFLMGTMLLAAAACLVAMPMLFIFESEIIAQLAANAPTVDLAGVRWMIIWVLACVTALMLILFRMFQLLKRIVDSVGHGDPFVPDNATRLTQMAWLTLEGQIVTLPLSVLTARIAEAVNQSPKVHTDIDTLGFGFSGNGLLLMLILFILARVFRQGAAMRAELEGTV